MPLSFHYTIENSLNLARFLSLPQSSKMKKVSKNRILLLHVDYMRGGVSSFDARIPFKIERTDHPEKKNETNLGW